MDVNILVQQMEANWQWYHTAAVVIGSVLCGLGIVVLLYFGLPIFFKE